MAIIGRAIWLIALVYIILAARFTWGMWPDLKNAHGLLGTLNYYWTLGVVRSWETYWPVFWITLSLSIVVGLIRQTGAVSGKEEWAAAGKLAYLLTTAGILFVGGMFQNPHNENITIPQRIERNIANAFDIMKDSYEKPIEVPYDKTTMKPIEDLGNTSLQNRELPAPKNWALYVVIVLFFLALLARTGIPVRSKLWATMTNKWFWGIFSVAATIGVGYWILWLGWMAPLSDRVFAALADAKVPFASNFGPAIVVMGILSLVIGIPAFIMRKKGGAKVLRFILLGWLSIAAILFLIFALGVYVPAGWWGWISKGIIALILLILFLNRDKS